MMTKNIVREALEHYIKTSNKPLLSWGLKPAWNKKKQKQAVSPAGQNAPSRSSRNLWLALLRGNKAIGSVISQTLCSL